MNCSRRELPSSAEEGWREAPGWCWSRDWFYGTNHPALRAPLLIQGGEFAPTAFIHTFIDRAYSCTFFATIFAAKDVSSKTILLFDRRPIPRPRLDGLHPSARTASVR